MIKFGRPVLTILILLFAGKVFAQNSGSSLDQTLDNLEKQAAAYPFEKVYLHLDKPYYAAGDTIWFKAYNLIGAEHYLSALSQVLNVDLIDERNTIKRSIKLPLIGGTTYGELALADTIREGSYRIRAYTNWMRNAGAEYFFDKTITIVNAITNKIFTRSSYTYSIDNGQQTVNAIINYATLEGRPYAGREVKYIIQLDTKKIASSKGLTDDKGNLHIAFTNPSPGVLTSGEINTTIQPEDEKAVTKTIAIKATTAKVDVQFFPEGGSLVYDIPSKIAVKAVGADGLGVDIKGTIIDDQNNEVTTFNTTHLGMGVFVLTPESGKNYTATVSYADGSTSTVALPKAMSMGYVMTIDDQTDPLNIKVKIIGDETQKGAVTFVAESGGKVYLQGKGKAGQTRLIANIPKAQLPSGIMQFTLFSDSGEPLNERLIFIQNPDQLKLTVTAPQQSYAPRQKVKISLNSKNANDQLVQGNFSVSVVDESCVPIDENTESTMLSNILLTSDLTGYIEQANYYFAHINEKTTADLDALMLTQGYHRFEWKPIINNIPPDINYRAEKSLTIAGTAKTATGKPVVNGKVALLTVGHNFFVMDTVTDKNGRFAFSLDYADSSKFAVKALTAKKEPAEIEIDKSPPLLKTNKYKADVQVSLNNGLEAYLQNSKKTHDEEVRYGVGDHSIVLKEVSIKDKMKTERQQEIDNAVQFSSNYNGKGNADQVITAEDLMNAGCQRLDCLSGRLVGITFTSKGAPVSTRGGVMMVVLDGIPLSRSTVMNDLNSIINITDIASIEVLRTPGYISIYNSASGVLVITTKHGGQSFINTKEGPNYIQPPGYYKSREFYSPQYDSPKIIAPIADLRTTIFGNQLFKPIRRVMPPLNISMPVAKEPIVL